MNNKVISLEVGDKVLLGTGDIAIISFYNKKDDMYCCAAIHQGRGIFGDTNISAGAWRKDGSPRSSDVPFIGEVLK